MPHYIVTWQVEIEADSPEAAAQAAREMQLDPTASATTFIVDDPVAQEAVPVHVDIIETEPGEHPAKKG